MNTNGGVPGSRGAMRSLHAGIMLVALGTGSCAVPATEEAPAPTPREQASVPTPRHVVAPIWLDNRSRPAGLDVVQRDGGRDVDYIIEAPGSGAAWLDYDLDGDLDLYLAQGATEESPTSGPPDVLLRNDGIDAAEGVVRFTDVTTSAGLGDTRWSFGVAVADFDNDGDPDIYLTNWGKNRLYRNEGNGRFTDIAEAAGVADKRWGTSAAWSDVDRDGDLDLYVANFLDFEYSLYRRRGDPELLKSDACTWQGIQVMCGPKGLKADADVFYRNDGDADGDGIPAFVDATASAGFTTPDYPALGVIFFDADNDGDPDLFVANDSVQNTFFVNRGDGTFQEEGLGRGIALDELGMPQACMGVDVGDLDGDGAFDLMVTNFVLEYDTFYKNDGNGIFSDISAVVGTGSSTMPTMGWGINFLDLDNDGWDDIFVAHGHVYPQVVEAKLGSYVQRNGVFRNLGNGNFLEVAQQAGPGLLPFRSSRATALGDLDGDGDDEILVTNRNAPPDLLWNDGGPGHWIRVRLHGVRSNREGIGSRITVRAGGRGRVRELRRNTSYLSSNDAIAHFGLGELEKAEEIEVRWPSGAVSSLRNVAADQVLTIKEPAAD